MVVLMAAGFTPDWLAARDPYDVAALDGALIASLRAWAGAQVDARPLTIVDLGSGTGSAIRRTLGWLGDRPAAIYAVDSDPGLLAQRGAVGPGHATSRSPASARVTDNAAAWTVTPVIADLLAPLASAGGPPDGTVDLVISHAVADLLPLDRFAARVAALLQPRGLAHLALTYDGETAFEPADDPDLEWRVIAAYHSHMDRGRAQDSSHGGSTAGLRLVDALQDAGLSIVGSGASVWDVRATDGPSGRVVLASLLDFVTRSVTEQPELSSADVQRWERSRRAALTAGTLRCRVRHLDVLVARPARA